MKSGKILAAALLLGAAQYVMGETYMVVMKETKVFDEPNVNGYVTKNQNDQEVVLSEGMAFKIVETRKGWEMIEYSPGLRGMVMSSYGVPSDNLKKPSAGSFNVSNQSGNIVDVALAEGVWTLTSAGKNYKGQEFGNVVIFFDTNGNQAFSLTNVGGKTAVYCYSNDITKFF